MIEFTKFNAHTGEVISWHQISHAELIPSQLAIGEGAALDKHENPATLFFRGNALYRGDDDQVYLISELVKKDLINGS